MPRLLIANVNNESMLADRRVVTYEFACATSINAMKHAWFAEPGDIVVLPEPLSMEMRHYAGKIKGISFIEDVTFVSPRHQPSEIPLLSYECLHDEAFLVRVKALMGERRDWTLLPYDYERSIASLGRLLGLNDGRGPEAFWSSGGHELFNDKKAFRSMAAGRGMPLADGETCSSPAQLLLAFDRLLDQTGAVIIKRSRQGNCLGNLIVSKNRIVDSQGAPDVLLINGKWPMERAVETVWNRLGSGADCHLIVESYHAVQAICYAEFDIRTDRRSPAFLNWGEQRMEPVFTGFDIPGTIPPYQAARFMCGAAELARLAQDLGYLGLIDVDGIVTKSGEVLFSEVNGRFAGCSHVHLLAELLVGPGYGDRATVLTRNRVAAPIFSDVLALMSANDLAFSRENGEGIVITGEDTARTGTISYMVIGKTRACAIDLEASFTDLMAMASNKEPLPARSLGTIPLCH